MVDFKTCKINIDNDGHYKCSILRKGVKLNTYALTEVEAFDKMFELIQELNKKTINMEQKFETTDRKNLATEIDKELSKIDFTKDPAQNMADCIDEMVLEKMIEIAKNKQL